jgi:O-methyltransferase involved in polyketide biosynthesis
MTEARIRPGLTGVPETLLLTLRAQAAREPGGRFRDPKAIELVGAIDYPFAESFPQSGKRNGLIALRAAVFDREIEEFLREHPTGTIVALGEGLETHFWRVDNGQAQWLTVDLPESAELRTKLLPPGDRQRILACSALDFRWMDEVDPANAVLIIAQGLLMYLEREQVHGLLAACAERFPGGGIVFDAIPKWWSRQTLKGKFKTSAGYALPGMPWSQPANRLDELKFVHPNIVEVRRPQGIGGARGPARLLALLRKIPWVDGQIPTVAHLRFGTE